MARGRFISESIATDARLNGLSVEAELVYLMTVPHLDRDGLIEGDPDVLWGKVCPKRRQFLDGMSAYIQEWAKAGLVLMYDTDEGTVLWFKGFSKNQQGMRYEREAQSKFPPPPGSEPTPDKLPTNSGNCPAEVKDQVKDQDQSSPPTPPPGREVDDDEFGAVIACWQDNMPGTITPILQGELEELVAECTGRSVIHGITVALEQNKRFFKYVASVARNHASGKEPPGRKAQDGGVSDAKKSALITRAATARTKIRTAEQFGGHIDPAWLQDIESAKGLSPL